MLLSIEIEITGVSWYHTMIHYHCCVLKCIRDQPRESSILSCYEYNTKNINNELLKIIVNVSLTRNKFSIRLTNEEEKIQTCKVKGLLRRVRRTIVTISLKLCLTLNNEYLFTQI